MHEHLSRDGAASNRIRMPAWGDVRGRSVAKAGLPLRPSGAALEDLGLQQQPSV